MKIDIVFTKNELEQLLLGVCYEWTYESDTGETVKVHLCNSETV